MIFAINSNNTARRFESKEALSSRGNGWGIFATAEELAGNKSISTRDIMEAFNELTNSNVAKFSDKLSGAKRLVKALEESEPLGKIGGSADPVEAAKDPVVEAANKAIKAESPKVSKPRTTLAGRVFLLHRRHLGSNPRRKGSHGHRSLGLFIDANAPRPRAITFEQFLAEGGRSKDLRWDIMHNNVEEVIDGKVVTPAELQEAQKADKE